MRMIPDFIYIPMVVANAVKMRTAYFRKQAKEKAK